MSDIAAVGRIVGAQPVGPSGHARARLQLGVKTIRAEAPCLTVIAKATFSFEQAEGQDLPEIEHARWSGDQLPLSLDQPSPAPGAGADELYYASDFAPRKAGADVLVVGHAHGTAPSQRQAGRFAVAGLEREFVALAEQPLPAIPLCCGHLEGEGTAAPVPVGPMRPARHARTYHGEGFDYGCYNAAPEAQRVDAIEPGATIELEGLSRRAQRRVVALPPLAPRVIVEARWWGTREVPMRCDTLWVDVDRELVVLLWRGDVEVVENASEVTRIVASLERSDRPRTRAQVLSLLQRGHIGYAVREVDLAPGAEPIPTDDPVLRMARYGTWRARAPEPELPLPQYAAISAELAERPGPEHREAVLSRHDYDEDRWMVEERGQLERMAQAALAGNATPAAVYSEHFIEAQDQLGTEREMARTLDEYAQVMVAMASSAEPNAVLDAHGLSLPEYLRLDRRWRAAMKNDPELSKRFHDKLGQMRAQPVAVPAPPSDDGEAEERVPEPGA